MQLSDQGLYAERHNRRAVGIQSSARGTASVLNTRPGCFLKEAERWHREMKRSQSLSTGK
jgi:hypothetical protein